METADDIVGHVGWTGMTYVSSHNHRENTFMVVVLQLYLPEPGDEVIACEFIRPTRVGDQDVDSK